MNDGGVGLAESEITLRAYIDAIVESYKSSSKIQHESLNCKIENIQDEIRDLRMTKAEVLAIKEATRLAKDSVDERLKNMNEFRTALKTQADSFLTRIEYNSQHGNLLERFNRMDEDIRTLRESRAELQGKASQSQVNIALIVAVIGIALSVMGLLLHQGG